MGNFLLDLVFAIIIFGVYLWSGNKLKNSDFKSVTAARLTGSVYFLTSTMLTLAAFFVAFYWMKVALGIGEGTDGHLILTDWSAVLLLSVPLLVATLSSFLSVNYIGFRCLRK